MKIGMTTVTFRTKNVEEIIRISKKAGIDGLEWAEGEEHIVSQDKAGIEAVKKLSKENNLEIFSYGSYCRMTDKEECAKAVETAAILGAPIIRVWAGKKGSQLCEREYYAAIVENSKYMAKLAKKEGIRIDFEYHPKTLTDNDDEAILLIERIGMDNVGLYWQTNCAASFEENAASFEKIRPYMFRNIHINTGVPGKGFLNISEVYEQMHGYFNPHKSENYNLIIEFVKDGTEDNFIKDVQALKRIIS